MNILQELKQSIGESESLGISDLLKMSDEYLSKGICDKACSCLKEALLLGERDVEVYNRLGYVNYCRHEYHTALECYQTALDICEDEPEVIHNLGLLYQAISEKKIAEQYFLKALEFPETKTRAYANLSRLALSSENYSLGWDYYRQKMNSANAEMSVPVELEEKTVLVFGDLNYWQEMFYLRFLPELVKIGAKKISYYASEELQILFRKGMDGVEILRSLPMRTQYDVILSIVDLPGVLSATQELSYLEPLSFSSPSLSSVKLVKNILPNNGRENIAVSWESMESESNGVKARVSPELLGESLRFSEANILVLQQNASDRDIRLLEKGLRRKVFNYGFINESVESTLAFLSEVNHYVSVGDHKVHLASSLNKKVSVLVSHPPQWQWTMEAEQSPWFPGFNLYRQDVTGCWEHACQTLKSSLHE